MKALILFDNDFATQDDIARTTACLMNARARVRLVKVDNITAPDFDGIEYLIMACPQQSFTDSVQTAVDASVEGGMRTLSMIDTERMVWFRQQQSA